MVYGNSSGEPTTIAFADFRGAPNSRVQSFSYFYSEAEDRFAPDLALLVSLIADGRSRLRSVRNEAGVISPAWPSSCATVAYPARQCCWSIEGGITMEFAGKVALITGGGGGIGRASAIGFAGRGAKVVVVDLDASARRGKRRIGAPARRRRALRARRRHEIRRRSGLCEGDLDAYGPSTASSTMPASRARSRRRRTMTKRCSTR